MYEFEVREYFGKSKPSKRPLLRGKPYEPVQGITHHRKTRHGQGLLINNDKSLEPANNVQIEDNDVIATVAETIQTDDYVMSVRNVRNYIE